MQAESPVSSAVLRPWLFLCGLAGWLCATAGPAAAAVSNPHNTGSCTACHRETPRFGIDTGRTVTYTTAADDPALCAPCHELGHIAHPVGVDAGSGAEGSRRSSYLPAGSSAAFAGKLVCTTCHFIHAADGRYALLRGFPGTPDPRHYASWQEFCLDCHGEDLTRRSPHRAGDDACGACHVAKPTPGVSLEVVGRDQGLCLLCHGAVRDAHYVDVDPFGNKRECRDCHDRHGRSDERPGLLNDAYLAAASEAVTVKPHYRKGLCLTCHANLDDYALRDEDVNALCNRCHESGKIQPNIHPLREVPAAMATPKGWPLAGKSLTCLTCHEQGHEDQEPRPAMLRGGAYARLRDACANCHTASDLTASRIHVDINAGSRCETCHKVRPVPGTDTAESVQLIADPNLLCLLCHDTVASAPSIHHTAFTDTRESASVPAFLPLYKGRVTCATCHNPHLLEPVEYRLRSGLASSDFCTGCHSQ